MQSLYIPVAGKRVGERVAEGRIVLSVLPTIISLLLTIIPPPSLLILLRVVFHPTVLMLSPVS